MEDDLSGVFHDPVDLDSYPSYEEKVDEPMDFGTIKAKLDNWEYRRNDPLGFARDMRLVSVRPARGQCRQTRSHMRKYVHIHTPIPHEF